MQLCDQNNGFLMATKRAAPRTAWKKGHAKLPNAGRRKGTPNKITVDMRRAVLNAFERLGGEEYLTRFGRSKSDANRRALVALFGKMIPLQVGGTPGEPIQVTVSKEESKL